ncbi:MAG: hypothetical protein GF387_03350 [Candidatus Portnoybacteria bacterium]|nr:hypothetical protein [Candidatus Portnoybacteria bacterium]
MNLNKKCIKSISVLIITGLIFTFAPVQAQYDLEDNQAFYVDQGYDWNDREQITATLKKISDKAYFYIEDEYWEALSTNQRNLYMQYLDSVADNFDTKTYPKVTQTFGYEWKPGIDDEEKITILLTRLKSTAGGYFNSKDEIPKTQEPTSNEREMIYINSAQIANSLIHSLIAHEFQHLINYNQKERELGVTEEVWLNELRSEYAPTAANYDSQYTGTNLERRVEDYLANPFNSLTNWTGSKYDYPSVNLFGQYLAEQFGDGIFKKMMNTNETGISSIERAVEEQGHNKSFEEIFNNWTVANYLNDTSLSNGQFGYKNSYLKEQVNVSPITYSITSTSIINIAQNVKNWAPYWYKFINKQDSGAIAKDLELQFEGETTQTDFQVTYILDYLTKPDIIGSINLANQEGKLQIPDFRDEARSVTIIVSNQFKKSGFDNEEETPLPFVLSVATTIIDEPVNPPDEPNPDEPARPEDFGLKEGDLISAEGDFDIFIINQYGYKRLFLNPTIFEMYGHLGSWEDVKTVTPEVRDAFITSSYYKYVNEEKVYELEVTGEDTGMLHWLNITGEAFLEQGGKPSSIFIINQDEFNWYEKGAIYSSL